MQSKNGASLWIIIMFGVAVFSMHFGASCMLWPVSGVIYSATQINRIGDNETESATN